MLAYHDKWLALQYNPADSTIKLNYNVGLNTVKYSKNNLLVTRDYLDFYADDPRATFAGNKHFTVLQSEPIFGLDAEAKSAYNLETGRVIPSVGLDLRIGKFHLEGQNYWSPKNTAFRQVIAIGYKQKIF
jgi:hypothetical protein